MKRRGENKLRGCFVEEGIVANAEGREKTPELSRLQGPRPSRGRK
jgi:hypothetical protein